MTVETTTPGGGPLLKSGPYNGDGAVTVFDYDFKIQAESELLVSVLSSAGATTELTLTTDYTVSGVGDDDGGQITLTSAALAPSGSQLVIEYNGSFNQTVSYSNQGRIQLSLLEDSLDAMIMHLRSLKERVDRAVKVSVFGTEDLDTLQSNVSALAAIEADLTALSGISADITAVAAVDADVATVAGIAGDVTSVVETFQGALASDPAIRTDGSALQVGDYYLNTGTGLLRYVLGIGPVTWGNAATLLDITAAGRALVDDADAEAQRATLELGSAATRAAEDTLTDGANLPDGAAVKAYVDTEIAGAGPSAFDLGSLSSSNSTATHGLGAIPTEASWYLRCTTEDGGFAVGDRIYQASFQTTADSTDAFTIWADATDVGFGRAGSLRVEDPAGAFRSLTSTRWNVHVLLRV